MLPTSRPHNATRVLRLWGPVAGWMGAIFFVSSGPVPAGMPPDWSTHGTTYLILCILICRALTGAWRARLRGRVALAAVVLCTVYGVSDEFHQSFVAGRVAEAADVAKDAAGAIVGAVVFRLCGAELTDEEEGREA